MDLEALREIFKDNRVHLAIGQIKKLMLATDRSVLRVLVSVLPEQREIIAKMSWSAVGENAGFFQFPNPDDIVLLGMADGNEDTAFVISSLTNRVDKIPAPAADGSMVAKARAGKKLWLISDTKLNLTRGDTDGDENLVLGQVLKSFLADLLDALVAHTHSNGNLGAPTGAPINAGDFSALKADPVDNGNILSDIAFTEK